MINRNYGNYRGLIRTVIDQFLWFLGHYKQFGCVDWSKVKRIVFVCQGNICRSPFAHFLATKVGSSLPVTSFGLATTTGALANEMAINVAKNFGVRLDDHRAVNIDDFEIRPGDLFVVMEDRHIKILARYIVDKEVQVCLMGLWNRPRLALIYDPFGQSQSYFKTCFSRIQKAVVNMLEQLDKAKIN